MRSVDFTNEETVMTKSTVTKVFIGSLIAIVGGVVAMALGLLVALATGTFEMTGPDVTGVELSASAPVVIVLGVIGVIAIVGGGIGQFVAWIGALVNTANLADKTWFVVLLVLGLFSFGFIGMVVYILAGPDGSATTPQTSTDPSGGRLAA
jgi:hypothetical protein